MTAVNNVNLSLLDRIRLSGGIERLKVSFNNMLNFNKEEALKQINDKNLRYFTLFGLQPVIRRKNLFKDLSLLNQRALEITDKILAKNYSDIEKLVSEDFLNSHAVLKWILETGRFDDGFNNQYDEILDMTAILLVKLFKEKSILHTVSDMIFNRHRRGLFIDDLLWAFFESNEPQSLINIADRLRSKHQKDIELARSVLSFIPIIGTDRSADYEREYRECIKWIQDNYLFMNRTGESFQQFRNPVPYVVSLESKYLRRDVNENVGEAISEEQDKQEQTETAETELGG